jgi:Double zinc ribbon/Adenylate and Guanylate cyclase catalytic domain
MQCPQCQFETSDTANFCEACGIKLARTCPSCEHEVRPSANFCPQCGTSLTTLMPAPLSLQAEPQPAREPEREPLSYTPQHLAEKILTTRSTLEGERKQVTVLFCDIANSTPLAERLGPERMHRLLNQFFELALDEVHRYEGTINQFLGDGFMALFGAPIAHEDHAWRAVLAAVSLRRRLHDGAPPLGIKLTHSGYGNRSFMYHRDIPSM